MWLVNHKRFALSVFLTHAATATSSSFADGVKVNSTNRQVFMVTEKQEQEKKMAPLLRGLAADCGNPDGSCCSTSDTYFGAGYCYDNGLNICSADNICVDCGGSSQQCCDTIYGLTCDDERNHCDGGTKTCQKCGYDGEPCCTHDPATPSCRDPYQTTCDVSTGTPTCRICGAMGGLCCEGSRPCESEFAVCDDATKRCVTCGGPGEECCPDAQGKGICNDDSKLRCVAGGMATRLGTCQRCGEEGDQCCAGAAADRPCHSSQLFCNGSNKCASCGEFGETCCPGQNSSTAPGSGTCHDANLHACVSDGKGGGVCSTCGADGERCCAGDIKCDSIYSICNSASGLCEPCGQLGGKCCNGFLCNNVASYTCNINHSSGTPVCVQCGTADQLACKGFMKRQCESEYAFVDVNGICRACGDEGKTCCPGSNPCKLSSSVCRADSMCGPRVPTYPPTQTPTKSPTPAPTQTPSKSPTPAPTSAPTSTPTRTPTKSPTPAPTSAPTSAPTRTPTKTPTPAPTSAPTLAPTRAPTKSPTTAPTSAPTKLPTPSPTLAPTKVPTRAPTPNPTQSPTRTPATKCPPINSPWKEIPPSTLTVAKSDQGVICRLILVKDEHRIPVARSYDAGDWHQYSGEFSTLSVACDPSECTFNLETPSNGAKYMLGATDGYTLTNEERAARFFESATFGMTMDDITSMAGKLAASGGDAFVAWMKNQMDEKITPVSSHRQFFRKHANAIFEGSSNLGEVTKPCEKSTTYRRYTFASTSNGKWINITSIGGTKRKIEIDGRVLTVIDGDVVAGGFKLEGSVNVCDRAEHYVGGKVRLLTPTNECKVATFGTLYGNPPVSLDGISGVGIIALDSTVAEPIDQNLYRGQTQMITIKKALNDPICNSIPNNFGPVPNFHATFNGTLFVHTPRFKILDNTLTAPLADGGGSLVAKTSGGASEYRAECANVARTFLNEEHCFLSANSQTCSIDTDVRSLVVCGSPNEVSNDLSLGGTQFNGAFDIITSWGRTSSDRVLMSGRRHTWTGVILLAPDQLRQRMAWILSQIFVVNADTVGSDWSEQHVHYYDIFVRNAFGNYRDILKEVSYSPMMANFLSYHLSKSMAYHKSENDVYRHPDENYAREVMQLFTIGLDMLNEDGTTIEGSGGSYSNDDIMEYARVWTGFMRQHRRANIENGSWDNKLDPMQIKADWRDNLPKMGLQGKYIGHGYPLCAELPAQHFLKSGAKYRLLGYTSFPELQPLQEDSEWAKDSTVKRFKADRNGDLYFTLCNSDSIGGPCNYAAIVTLPGNLKCTNAECNVDTVRAVEVGNGVYYEYIRPACANLAFYENPTKIKMREGSSSSYMCADPRLEEEAGALCCDSNRNGFRRDEYLAERVRLSTAQNRCDADPSKAMCSSTNVADCGTASCSGDPYYWTAESCKLKVKIAHDRKIAIVHNVPTESSKVTSLVDMDTRTYFRVHWNDVVGVDNLFGQCGSPNSPCSRTGDGICLCDVSASEYRAFSSAAPPTRDEVLALPFGAFQPSGGKVAVAGMAGVWVYESGAYSEQTVFEVVDDFGRTHLRKNKRATVSLVGTASRLDFPTPVHMMSLAEENERDAMYETDAALDHYFYHPNTAPFLSYRFAQRFGISNPTPAYIKAITQAFKYGQYIKGGTTFGSGKYGDLPATVAAVLLHDEARNTLLEADSVHGAFREPLLKIMQLMRSLQFQAATNSPMTLFSDIEDIIGQLVFHAPDVFSFFHPEFQPTGIISASSMVSPEALVINSPEIFSTVNGLQSLIKYGLLDCHGGFGAYRTDYLDGSTSPYCKRRVTGAYIGSEGYLSWIPNSSLSASQVVDQLSVIMTSGRLSSASRALIEQTYKDEMIATSNHALATIRAQQLILTTPEFHTTGRTAPNGQIRSDAPIPPTPIHEYKAVVFLMLNGGCDSFNMIVPHTCAGSNLVTQYNQERGDLALAQADRTRVINVTGQPCQQFVLHPKLQTVQNLYNTGDLSFFFNTGVLNAPSSNTNYSDVSKTHFFAHNTMAQEVARLDPFDMQKGTGVLGRLSDVLNSRGYQPNSFSIDGSSMAVTGNIGAAINPVILSHAGLIPFNPSSEVYDIKSRTELLNGGNDLWSSNIFGETWSERLTQAIWETDMLEGYMGGISLPSPPDHTLAEAFQTIIKLMMTHSARRNDRDVFYVSLGGWDHHDFLNEGLMNHFNKLDESLNYFQNNLKTQGLWDNVVLTTVSDFGRTLSPNSGQGSDHGWGGNYFVTGGGIKGGQGICQYPSDITENSPLNVGRGRMLPTCAWESMWNPIIEWMLDGSMTIGERDSVLVNAARTGAKLYKMNELFG
ncbi:hypothetical protein ACA910_018446 [Epithemia clementina (nom. ined.)]